jgi:molybdopterin-guanine dinucleotide biosynthesis protein A
MINIPCVIFAGGKSSRMGEDKSLLPFGSFTTLTEFQYSRLSKIFTNVYISCKDKNKFNFNAQFIEDDNSSDTFAPTAGFIASFKALKSDSFFALSVDSPFVNKCVITKLINKSHPNLDAIIAKTDQGIQPLCGIYFRSLEEKFQQMQKEDNHKLGFLLKDSSTEYLYFSDTTLFSNLNYPKEYKEALENYKFLNIS